MSIIIKGTPTNSANEVVALRKRIEELEAK